MKKLLGLLLVLSFPAPLLAQDALEESIVFITCQNEATGETRTGSGVVVSEKGYVLTALHVAPKGFECRGSRGVADPNNMERMVQTPLAAAAYDIALLRFTRDRTYSFLKYCELDDNMKRKRIFAAGYPTGSATGKPSFRSGILSTTFQTPEGYLETDSLTAAGMSGGPILADDEKSLIGIVSGTQFGADGAPVFYGITPIVNVAVTSFQLTRNEAGCYPDVPSLSEIDAEILELSARLMALQKLANFHQQNLAQMSDHPNRLDKAETQLTEIEQNFTWDAAIDDGTGDLLISYQKIVSGDLKVDAIKVKVRPFLNEFDSARKLRNTEGSIMLNRDYEAVEVTSQMGQFLLEDLVGKNIIDQVVTAGGDAYDPEHPISDLRIEIQPKKGDAYGAVETINIPISQTRWNRLRALRNGS
jgi:hypothetical protein